MKELSIEEKAKRYDESLERAKKLKETYDSTAVVGWCEYIFNELAESEDEKIRKEIIVYLSTVDDKELIPYESWLSWLEKQGTAYTKRDVDDAYLKGVTNTKNEIEKQYEATYQIRKDIATFIFNYRGDIKDRAKWMDYLGIKVSFVGGQGEQKETLCDKCRKAQPSQSCQDITASGRCYIDGMNTSNKVEPKFKQGEWIVWKDKYYKVNYNGCGYELFDQNGLSTSWDYKTIEDNAHLWTIQDAKDGDVLFHSDSASNGIFIFKELLKYDFSEKVICYCDYDSEDHFCLGEHHTCCWADAKILYPATKEQRDLLFKKMYEAGYEWDTEKKELMKIHVIDEGKSEIDYCFTKMMNGEKVSPTWSDVDEADLNNIIWLCNNCIRESEHTWFPSQATRIKSLIERIKDTVFLQPKKEWSEEDERMLVDCFNILHRSDYSIDKVTKTVNWLKSIKDRIISYELRKTLQRGS